MSALSCYLSCNISSFGTGFRDKLALVGGIAVAAFIKKPLEHGFRHSARLSAFATTVYRPSKLNLKQHTCVKLKFLEYTIRFYRIQIEQLFQTV